MMIITKNGIYLDEKEPFGFYKTSRQKCIEEHKMLSMQHTTPLHIACLKNDIFFVESQINILTQFFNFKDIYENYPMFCLFKQTNISKNYCMGIIHILLKYGYNLHTHNKYNQNILHQCCLYDLPELVDLFCYKNVSVNHLDFFKKSPLHYSCEYGFIDNVIVLLDHGSFVNYNTSPIQPLHIISLSKKIHPELQIHLTKLLLQYNADINKKHSTFEYTPLHSACLNENILLVYFLLEHGADVNAKQVLGNTPLHLSQNINIVRLLIQYGADTTLKNLDNKIPLDHAILHKHSDLIDLYKSI